MSEDLGKRIPTLYDDGNGKIWTAGELAAFQPGTFRAGPNGEPIPTTKGSAIGQASVRAAQVTTAPGTIKPVLN